MTTLYYVHDPMCSWCWGFTASWRRLLEALPTDIHVVRLLGGLAADTNEPMPRDMQESIAANWQRIERTIPGIQFNFDFWVKTHPRRSTYPACRAVIAARRQGEHYDSDMTAAIQRAYYQQARNPSDDSTLIELAGELGLDVDTFGSALNAPATQKELEDEIHRARTMHADSFPSLVLEQQGNYLPIAIDYNDHSSMLAAFRSLTSG